MKWFTVPNKVYLLEVFMVTPAIYILRAYLQHWHEPEYGR